MVQTVQILNAFMQVDHITLSSKTQTNGYKCGCNHLGNWVTTIQDFSPRNSSILPTVKYNRVHQLRTDVLHSDDLKNIFTLFSRPGGLHNHHDTATSDRVLVVVHYLRSCRHGDGNHRRLHRFWCDVSSNLLQLQNQAEKTSHEQVGECSTDGNKNIEKKVTQKEEKIIRAQQCACINTTKKWLIWEAGTVT